jgi:multiple sugar transport system permease protein
VRLLTVALGIFRSQTPQGNARLGRAHGRHDYGHRPTLVLFLIFGKRVVNSINFTGFR